MTDVKRYYLARNRDHERVMSQITERDKPFLKIPGDEWVRAEDYDAMAEHAAMVEMRVTELEAAVTRYRQYEYVEAQHDETGRSWFGARYNIPTRFHEVSNESGEPGPTARAAVNKSAQRIEVPK